MRCRSVHGQQGRFPTWNGPQLVPSSVARAGRDDDGVLSAGRRSLLCAGLSGCQLFCQQPWNAMPAWREAAR